MDNASIMPALGETFYQGQTPPTTYTDATRQLEGFRRVFTAQEQTVAVTGPRKLVSALPVVCRLTRLTGATSLSGGEVIKLGTADGFFLKRCVENTDTADEAVQGVVHHLYGTNAVVQHDLFWLVVQGPVYVNKDGNAKTTGTKLLATNDGKVKDADAPASDQEAMDFAYDRIIGVAADAATAGASQVLAHLTLPYGL